MINLPSENKKWSQPNSSDLLGNIYTTKNINFDEQGYLKLSGRAVSLLNEGIDANIDQSASMNFDEGGYFTQTWDKPFRINIKPLTTIPTQITGSNVPAGTVAADSIWFNNKIIVSEANDVKFREGSDWYDTNISLSTAQHPLCNFVYQNGWCIGSINSVRLYSTISTTPVLVETLILPEDYQVVSITYFNQNVYIGTRHTQGGKAVMFVWNGNGTSYQHAYEVDSHLIHDIVVFQDSIVALVSNGALMVFNGSGFTPLAYFPIFFTPFSLAEYNTTNLLRNCLRANEDVLYINFSFNTDNNIYLSQPAGIWCYEPNVGLYHKYSPSISNADYETVLDSNVSVANNTFTIASGAIPNQTICPVLYTATTPVAPLKANKGYWAIRVSDTVFKLAYNKEDALAGTAIDLTGTPSGNQIFTFLPETDYGQFISNRGFAIFPINQSSSAFGTDLIWSAENMSRSSASLLGYLGTVTEEIDARGYYISPKMFSQETTDKFNNFVIKYSPLLKDDKIIIKYRTTDDGVTNIYSTDWDMTWTSSTTFTSTETGWSNAEVGDEVEILRGAGAGLLAHITDISVVTGTYTITIDETFDNYTVNDIGIATFRNWTKFITITSDDTDGFVARQLDIQGKFIQIKVELRGKGVKIEEIKIDNQYLLPSSR
jgi:hypothetical protein